jgi:hypothetical protein
VRAVVLRSATRDVHYIGYGLLVSFLNCMSRPKSPFRSAYLNNSKWGGLLFLSTINTYEAVKLELHVFLTAALDGYEWSPFCSGLIRPGRKNHPYTLDYKKDGRKASMDMTKRKIHPPVKKTLREHHYHKTGNINIMYIEARSRNHCCGKDNRYYTLGVCVCVVLVIQHANSMRCITLSVACLALPYSST